MKVGFFLLLLFWLLFFAFSSGAIFNLETNQKGAPEKVESRHWLFVAQGCHSCSEVLASLEKICSGKKPNPSKIGFFIIGSSADAMKKKLKSWGKGYETFSGSPGEFHKTYQLFASPSLRVKETEKIVSGKNQILDFLKKDPSLSCAPFNFSSFINLFGYFNIYTLFFLRSQTYIFRV